QLRLRNLGGIIIIDFIDMTDAEHKRQVLRQLEKSLARDHAKTTVYDFSPLGLVEMTRKRTTESLEHQLSEPCHECGGRGMLKTPETVTYEIFREIVRQVRQFDAARLLVMASPKVVARITEEESAAVAELEEFLGKSIRFQPDDQYAQEQLVVVLRCAGRTADLVAPPPARGPPWPGRHRRDRAGAGGAGARRGQPGAAAGRAQPRPHRAVAEPACRAAPGVRPGRDRVDPPRP